MNEQSSMRSVMFIYFNGEYNLQSSVEIVIMQRPKGLI